MAVCRCPWMGSDGVSTPINELYEADLKYQSRLNLDRQRESLADCWQQG